MDIHRLLPSLRRKIALAYTGIAVLASALSLFAFEELRVLDDKTQLGERVTGLFDTAMEIRRFERNYFLHGQNTDFEENVRFCERMGILVDGLQADIRDLGLVAVQARLRDELSGYRALIARYPPAAAEERLMLEPQIRSAGQRIVADAEDIVAAERQSVRTSLSSLRTLLIAVVSSIALLAIAIGQALARRVVQPLQNIEREVGALAKGERRALQVPGEDREIVAIVAAFNQLLRDLDVRQKHLLRSEKLASMGTMVSGVAHELNNPVSNIWSSCQLLQDDATLSAEQRELLQQIDEQCVRARNIIRSLLDFGRDRPFARENVVLVDLVEQTLRFLKGERPSALTVSVDVPAELAVPADRQRLQQALLNLIRNAIDASAEHIAVSARKHSEAPRTDDDSVAADCPDAPWLEILVRDDGHGIPPDVLPRIFDPFFTTKEVGRGMGIGLFIAYQIIEEHDGCIGVQSRPGEGTRFAVRLPAPANNGNTP